MAIILDERGTVIQALFLPLNAIISKANIGASKDFDTLKAIRMTVVLNGSGTVILTLFSRLNIFFSMADICASKDSDTVKAICMPVVLDEKGPVIHVLALYFSLEYNLYRQHWCSKRSDTIKGNSL